MKIVPDYFLYSTQNRKNPEIELLKSKVEELNSYLKKLEN